MLAAFEGPLQLKGREGAGAGRKESKKEKEQNKVKSDDTKAMHCGRVYSYKTWENRYMKVSGLKGWKTN